MQIAILGGTGALGGGLARRLASETDHDLVVGSRAAERAEDAAAQYRSELPGGGDDAPLEGAINAEATAGADVVVTAVPAPAVGPLVESVAPRIADDAILVTPAVALDRSESGFHTSVDGTTTTTAAVATAAPEQIPVVGAFHSLPAGRLADLDAPLGIDTLVVGDDPEARRRIATLVEEVDGLRALDAGPLANAAAIESLTALQLTLMRHDEDLHDVGVRFE